MALTLNDLVMIYSTLDRPERADAAAEESRQLFRELGNLPILADSYGQAFYRLARSGRFDGALARGDRVRADQRVDWQPVESGLQQRGIRLGPHGTP
jgi:hypothetical protein